jgi:hypothetical protein
MTKEEILLMNELIKSTVRSVVKEVLQEEFKGGVKKDIKEVKMLLAKTIKEGYINSSAPDNSLSEQQRRDLRQSLRESIGEDFRTVISKSTSSVPASPKLNLSQEQAVSISMNGTLPNIDAPIPMIKKDSPMWKEMENRIK